ncbi:unnamed protein product, partial [Ixodes persulcatus]
MSALLSFLQDCDKLGRMDDVSEALEGDLYSPCSPSPPPQNGNCRPDDADSPFKGPASRNTQGALVSSSDSDDDDVIRAVKETLGVRTHKPRSPQAQERKATWRVSLVSTAPPSPYSSSAIFHFALPYRKTAKQQAEPTPKAFGTLGTGRILESVNDRSAAAYIRDLSTLAASVRMTLELCRTPPRPLVFPTVELPCDASDSDSEGKLMIAESPVSAESPRRTSEDGETNSRLAEDQRDVSRVSADAAEMQSVAQTPATKSKASPEDSNNSKGPKSVDDMPLFTLKFTKTKSGGWVMVRPRSEDSDAGDEATPRKRPPTRRRRVVAPKKAREKVTAKSIFDSSDDEPLSELRNRGATTATPPAVRNSEDNADGNGSANNTNTLSDLERKLEDVERRRSDGAPAKKRRKVGYLFFVRRKICYTTGSVATPASKLQSSEAPQVARLMRCIAAAGLRVSYVRLLEPTDSVQVKAAKLLDVLEKAGLKGD